MRIGFVGLSLLLLVASSSGQRSKQQNAEWGLGRVSEAGSWSSNGPYTYKYFDKVVNDITVYILDTGITPTHRDFGNRARVGTNFVNGEKQCDMNGHGTHVAGTIGGSTYGVCKTCKLVGVKVLGRQGGGSMTGITNGIKWATNDCKDGSKCVINMSLGGGSDRRIDEAVKQAADKGIAVIVASGNENQDACRVSPARAKSAYCVSASDVRDGFASFSNWGSCVETIGPGVNIKSTWIDSDPDKTCDNRTPVTATRSSSGTSMASPHVAGLAAQLRALGYGGKTAQETYDALTRLVQKNKIKGAKGQTPNYLAFNGFWE